MIALKVNEVKSFMNGFVAGTLFDPFLTVEGLVVTSITYNFDGALNQEFYDEEKNDPAPPYKYQPWSDTKAAVFSLIKGTKTPICLRFMLALKPEKATEMLSRQIQDEDFSYVKNLLLTVKYENGAITLTTGTSYNSFVMSHDADNIWDKNIQKYLAGKGIDFEIIS
ncbi:MAG: DUF5721 family protein [Lachnospiraceae bacterium]|nr:DUF5721 family protein [Lachnospiraceae bacterium]